MTIIIDGYIAVVMGCKYRSICASVSGHCLRFIFKICQTVAGISVMSPFHRFLDYFCRILTTVIKQVIKEFGGNDDHHPWMALAMDCEFLSIDVGHPCAF